MTSLLVDYENVIHPNDLPVLKRKIYPAPITDHTLGIILVVPKEVIAKLGSIPLGENRIRYLDNQNFIRSLKGFAYLIYDEDRNICDIVGLVGPVLKQIVDKSITDFPKDVILTIGADTKTPDLSTILKNYAEAGFSNPYITKTTPMGTPYSPYGVCMSRSNHKFAVTVTPDIKYVLEQFASHNESCCSVKVKLSKNTITYLKKLCNTGATMNLFGDMSQKEVAGRLVVSDITKDLVHIVTADKKSSFSGHEEGVDVAAGVYNFHSHPKEAYDRHKVQFGWPSGQDYLGFVSSVELHSTVFHIVASIEGAYIISFTKCWTKQGRWTDEMTEFVAKNYTIHCKKGDTIDWYLKKVNRQEFNGCRMFSVQYLPWKKVDQVFTIYYPKIGLNCFAMEETLHRYTKLNPPTCEP